MSNSITLAAYYTLVQRRPAYRGECAGGIGVGQFQENAFYLIVWRAFLAALSGLILIVTHGVALVAAFLISADIALLFSLGLMVWLEQLNEERIVCTEPWRMLKPSQRPAGRAGREWAYGCLRETALRFAKGASALAIALSTSALVGSMV